MDDGLHHSDEGGLDLGVVVPGLQGCDHCLGEQGRESSGGLRRPLNHTRAVRGFTDPDNTLEERVGGRWACWVLWSLWPGPHGTGARNGPGSGCEYTCSWQEMPAATCSVMGREVQNSTSGQPVPPLHCDSVSPPHSLPGQCASPRLWCWAEAGCAAGAPRPPASRRSRTTGC